MSTAQSYLRSLTLALAVLSLAGSGFSPRAREAWARHQPHHVSSFSLPEAPQDPGAPTGRREGGSSRGDKIFTLCKTLAEVSKNKCATSRLTALVPETSTRKLIWGFTAADYPEFVFYLSKFRQPNQPKTTQLPIEFVLQDENDHYVYKTKFVLPLTEGGFIRIPVPKSSEPLQEGKRYTWTLLTHFSPNETNYVHGRIYRTALSSKLRQQLQTATASQRLDLYLKEGLWFDALSMLVGLKQKAPQDLQLASQWSALLQDIRLAELAQEPILPCCPPEPQVSLAGN